MMYLIGQLAVWLLLTAAFAGVAGWAYAAQRAAPEEQALRRERDHLLKDIARFAGGESVEDASAAERELEALRRKIEVRDGRIAELERGIAAARARADEGAGRIAELERAPRMTAAEHDEVARLRALVAQHEDDRAREVEVAAEPVEEDQSAALQGWRLRYFEQRVRYLEGLAAQPQERAAAAYEEEPQVADWRAREAGARAAFLEAELRAATAPAPGADTEDLVRWRLRYLERRVAHLQQQAAAPVALPPPEPSAAEPDADRWQWRARYLEARLRRLEQRAPAAAEAQRLVAEAPVQAQPAQPAARPQRPPTLPAPRNGAADDFTLIEDVSVLQQTTLYSIGVFHFDQIAAWTPEHVAWVDQYLRLRGRIDAEEWVVQARELAERGVRASRRAREAADA